MLHVGLKKGCEIMLLYTWKDIERKFQLNRHKWETVIDDIEIYVDEVIIYLNKLGNKSSAKKILCDIFNKKYDHERNRIYLDFLDEYLNITYEIEEYNIRKNANKDNVRPTPPLYE